MQCSYKDFLNISSPFDVHYFQNKCTFICLPKLQYCQEYLRKSNLLNLLLNNIAEFVLVSVKIAKFSC